MILVSMQINTRRFNSPSSILVLVLLFTAALYGAPRGTVSLDGVWRMADSVDGDRIPAQFSHTAPVPGLANLATPPFPDVDRFDSREFIATQIRNKLLPESARTTAVGVPRQKRNWFWYERTFRAPARREVAVLKINKAQFGTAVWLNGKKIGEYTGCFTASYFDVTAAVNWLGENRLIVRIGAHPAALPPTIMPGIDQEKIKWTPGIYDSVSVFFSDNPFIEQIQVAPRLATSEIVIQTVVHNRSAKPVSFALTHNVREWKSGAAAGRGTPRRMTLAAGERQTVMDRVGIPKPSLWSPERPFLYVLDSSTGGDSASTRFGMREFRFDTATRRAYLNGSVYFMRGSNITLHRFFEDPKAGALPWNEKWVRKLLAEIPKQLHWNTFRFCIGPVPDFWLDVADEAGLLIQNEYFIWTLQNNWHKEWDLKQLTADYRDWMRDNWNHASVVIWDASNESWSDELTDIVIPAVRGDDLSNRPWENSFNLPGGPDDPMEHHPYLFSRNRVPGKAQFDMTMLEDTLMPRPGGAAAATGHALILNEYGWLWLNRDGTPTVLTTGVYENLLGPNSTTEQRFQTNAYLLAGLTEYWRAHRLYAGILHFVYLMSSYPGVYTSDHFRDIEKLDLEPNFVDYVGESFKPLGVYIDFWRPTLQAGAVRKIRVMMVNDIPEARRGILTLRLEPREGGSAVFSQETAFEIGPSGQHSIAFNVTVPDITGDFLLRASASSAAAETTSRRFVKVTGSKSR